MAKQELYYKVNVEGTKAVIAASLAHGVKYLVYTSSAGLVFDGQDAIDVDERLPPPDKAMDAYNNTKGIAEKLVIEANGKQGLKTVSLRPAGIFGYSRLGCIHDMKLISRLQPRGPSDHCSIR